MKSVLAILALFVPLSLTGQCMSAAVDSQRHAKGNPLYGKVQVVKSFHDLKIQLVNSLPVSKKIKNTEKE